MNDQDLTWLVDQIAATAELLGHEIKPNAAALLADVLSTYPRDVLAKALARVRTEHTIQITPIDLLKPVRASNSQLNRSDALIFGQALEEKKR